MPHAAASPSLLDGAEAVVHLAGESVFQGRWTEEKKERIRSSRVEGTRRLVDAMVEAPVRPRVLVCASAIGYYGDRGDVELQEESGSGSGFLAGVCQAWESEAMRAAEFGIRVVTVRTGVVLGRDGGALPQMLTPFKLGLGGRLGSGRQYVSWIHVDDLTRIFLRALEDENLHGAVNGVAPGPLPNTEFTAILASVLRRPAVVPVPSPVLRLLLGGFAGLLLDSQRVVPRKLQQVGFSFAFPDLRQALEDLL